MTTTTYEAGPSRAELEVLLAAAVRAATPAEQGRQQAQKATGTLLTALTVLAAAVAAYDLGLLLGSA